MQQTANRPHLMEYSRLVSEVFDKLGNYQFQMLKLHFLHVIMKNSLQVYIELLLQAGRIDDARELYQQAERATVMDGYMLTQRWLRCLRLRIAQLAGEAPPSASVVSCRCSPPGCCPLAMAVTSSGVYW